MKEVHYDFIDLDSEESFELLGKTLGGTLEDQTLTFNNEIVKGQLIKATPDTGLWIRKWKFITIRKIILHKHKAPVENEKKLILIYFLNPSIFSLKYKNRDLSINCPCNNLFLSSTVDMDFSVIPKQPFYVLDIAFTISWLKEQFKDADKHIRDTLSQIADRNTNNILKEPCNNEEYKLLNELELSMTAATMDPLFIRSRVYNLILSFFTKILNRSASNVVEKKVHYDQIMQVNQIIEENLSELPKLEIIAKKVNLSVSSLMRQFRLLYGKSIYEYFMDRRMEFAKKMILEQGLTIKKVAELLGYKQASHFIESFTKHQGYSPGSLKTIYD